MQIRSDISTQWRIKAQNSLSPLAILSPYITGDCAFSLLQGKRSARVYTLFNTEVFASGASDIYSIAKLVDAGYQVFNLDRLHAKIVMDEDGFATLGSQNMTTRGVVKNREMSVCFEGERARSRIRAIIEPWLDEAKPITGEMVADMIKALPELTKAYQGFHEACTKQQAILEASERARKIKRDKEERRQQIARLKTRFRSSINQGIKSNTVKFGRVRQEGRDRSPTLAIQRGENLLLWDKNRKAVELKKLSRYLCVLDTGEFGWARVAGGRITKVGRVLSLGDGWFSEFPGVTITLSTVPRKIARMPLGTNLVVDLNEGGTTVCTIPMEFDLRSITAFDPIAPVTKVRNRIRRASSKTTQVMRWIAGNKQAFQEMIRKQVAENFQYEKNNKLYGINASKFFGPVGTQCQIELAFVKGNPILDVTRI